ncbi:NAD(P)-binding protein [Hesseltinella vesiculosa]|uniref:3beta-hydroxysteroid 3-dehydrogenase n=1 Tax=Hesseltinella vesiculosa TaxID=101127 RepID=A0A1X2GLJ0_9FUNG|nr:NAD(P)-binding protein [Hesseltinella vesiculosa]
MEQTAIVTGANSGVGYGIVQQLLQTNPDIQIVMACRNPDRASRARASLMEEFPTALIHVELVDVASATSVLSFCTAIKNRYSAVSHIFCNAGILSAHGINWYQTFKLALTDPVGLLERSDATKQIVGELNQEGMGKVFAANVFGHFVMMRELETLLAASGDGRVIWTSSITADDTCFDMNDWQGVKSEVPYESSKWACDLLATASHDHFKKSNLAISSFTTSPGVVASSIGDLPAWITMFRVILHYIMRFLGVTSQNITAYRGAFADAYVAFAPLLVLTTTIRYLSLTNRWGKTYVGEQPLSIDLDTANLLYQKCNTCYKAQKKSLPMDLP